MDKSSIPTQPTEEKLKKGDYSVHLYIEESKGLLPTTSDKTFNPVITVNCFSKQKCTQKLKNVTSGATSLWNEHLYFSKLSCSTSELESVKILIEVKDSRTLKDSLIGSYEFDFTYIYFQPRHSLIHQWIILSNPYSSDITTQRGLLKLGVNILHESDKPEDLTAKSIEDSILIPPQVSIKSIQLIIQLISAIGLPKMDKSGTCDAYCIASFSNAKNRTKVVTADESIMSVSWFQELWLPVCQPCIANKVVITLWDKDLIGDDQLIGSLSVHWDTVAEESNSKFMWAQIYGAPENIENEAAENMNTNDKLASHWRGRVLLRLFKRETERATFNNVDIESEDMRIIAQEYEIESNYQINAQVFEAVNLPKPSGGYTIVVKFADGKCESKPMNAADSCCKWYETLKRRVIGIPDNSVLPDIFVYLIQDKQPICFARLKQSECNEPWPKERWLKFTPDPAINKVENAWEGGYVLMRIFVGLEDTPGYDKKLWDAKIVNLQNTMKKKLICNLYQCRNLPAADPTGFADPYVKVFCGAAEYSTDRKAQEGILNPLWYESFQLEIAFTSITSAPPIIVQVWDYDAGSIDDIMGICTVNIENVPINPANSPRPSWHKLSLGTEETEEGEILISFMIIDGNPPAFLMPKLIDVNIDIFALGFRDLKPALGWLPVNKPFLKIDARSIQLPGEQTLKSEMMTQPNNQGPNSNIGSVLSLKTRIPIDPLFCPNLTCTVYDFLLSGKSQPILGSFNLDLHHMYALKFGEELVKQQLAPPSINNLKQLELKKLEFSKEFEAEGLQDSDSLILSKTMVAPVETVGRESFSVMPMSLSEALMPGNVVILPQFKPGSGRKMVEVKFKDRHYMAIGYNREANDGKKHYRYMLETSLEKSELFGVPPFQTFPIKKGQTRGVTSGMFSGKKRPDQNTSLSDAGIFKGVVRIKTLKTGEVAKESERFEHIRKLLLKKTDCVVRIYIIECLDLDQKDVDSPSDPYLVIKLGNQRINDRENAIMDNPCPKFLRSFDLRTSFPGDSALKIQVWDFNDHFPDTKIGTAKIDLEDRFFNETWRKMPDKPIETHKLLEKSCKLPKGFIRFWLEILPTPEIPSAYDLKFRPPSPFELRLIIWRSEDVPNMDIEGVSDLYLIASINNKESKETDTHYRAQNGTASWNWRMKFKLFFDDQSKCLLNMSLWDRDLLSSNEAIGDACLDLTDLAMNALETGEKVKKYGTSAMVTERAFRRESEKFFVEFKTREKDGAERYTGKVLVSVEILPEDKAAMCVNGEGRAEPNVEPVLEKPEGRVELSLNPVKMVSQMVGPEVRRKVYLYCCLAFCVVLCAAMLPMVLANAAGRILF